MKLNFFLLAICLTFIFASCSSDDDNGVDSEPGEVSILGTWELISAVGALPLDLNMDGMSSANLLDELSCFEDIIVISDDNTYTQDVTEIDVTLDVSGIIPVVNAECTGDILSEAGAWSLEEDQLTFASAGLEPMTVSIILTENTLSFSDTLDEDIGEIALEFTRR